LQDVEIQFYEEPDYFRSIESGLIDAFRIQFPVGERDPQALYESLFLPDGDVRGFTRGSDDFYQEAEEILVRAAASVADPPARLDYYLDLEMVLTQEQAFYLPLYHLRLPAEE
jgi:hypothetical protein